MPYIEATGTLLHRLGTLNDVLGTEKTALFTGLTQAQTRQLLAGKEVFVSGKYFHYADNLTAVLRNRVYGLERKVDKYQFIDPTVSRKEVPDYMTHLVKTKEYQRSQYIGFGDARAKKRQEYMMAIRDLGIDPATVPSQFMY